MVLARSDEEDIIWIDYVILSALFLFVSTYGTFASRVFIVVVLFFVIAIWSIRRARKQAEQNKNVNWQEAAPEAKQTPAHSAATNSGSVSFRVAGVTFKNEDGTSRQSILRHIKFEDSPYADGIDPIDLNVTIEETEYNGEQAFAVFANGYQIGFVPKGSIDKVA